LLAGGVAADRGRNGMSDEQVLRALVIKQANGFSYEGLAFHLADSQSYRAFCLLGLADIPPSKSTLQRNLKRVRTETLERVNRALVHYAQEQELENGKRLRSDSTVIEAAIHEPTDSSLLLDCVRVLTRWLREAREYIALAFTNHLRRAKRRALEIQRAPKAEQRVPLYRNLVDVVENTVDAARLAVENLVQTYPREAFDTPELHELRGALEHHSKLAETVLEQTRRRVFNHETVPAPEKIVSIFEPHTDIIRKDRRETLYGHKVFLTTGASGLIVDCVLERGNPADSSKAVKLMKRAVKVLGTKPEQVVFDGGFSSRDNLTEIKALGIRDVAFTNAPGLAIKEMVKRTWLYQRLRHFRAGIEGTISFLKRCFGWDRCAWRSYGSFRAYAWGSVIAANLVMLARHSLA
jgi:transposase, IS5 family